MDELEPLGRVSTVGGAEQVEWSAGRRAASERRFCVANNASCDALATVDRCGIVYRLRFVLWDKAVCLILLHRLLPKAWTGDDSLRPSIHRLVDAAAGVAGVAPHVAKFT